MARFERSIRFACDAHTGEVIQADQLFQTARDSFEVRKQFQLDNIHVECCECGQRLNVSGSKLDRIHFKHEPGHSPCLLTSGTITLSEAGELSRHFVAKESERHHYLKSLIARQLSQTEGVNANSIVVDSRFIIHGDQRRRPDVSCEFRGHKLVFEIQLSPLSLRYIYGRYEFYKKNGYFLIWVLDELDVHAQSTMNRDIKYLSRHQNFFKLDEASSSLRFDCRYKSAFLTPQLEIMSKWQTRNIALDELRFEDVAYEVYYFSYEVDVKAREVERTIALNEQKEVARLAEEQVAIKAVDSILAQLREFRFQGWCNAEQLQGDIDQLTLTGRHLLTDKLNGNRNDEFETPALNYWISSSTARNYRVIEFLLKQTKIDIYVNRTDTRGKSALQEIYLNDNFISKYYISALLFRRGYILRDDDAVVISEHEAKGNRSLDLLDYQICSRLTDRELIDDFRSHRSVVHTLESAKQKKIVGFRYRDDQWNALAINAIQYYPQFWDVIETAFKVNDVWEQIVASDTKKTLDRKLQAFYQLFPKQSDKLDSLIWDLYPEIYQA